MAKLPYVFIGSSSEGLNSAKAIQANLQYVCESHIWSQGLFGLSEGTLETLVNKLDSFDFAILCLTPDDLTISRGEEKKSPRDNVILELGLFMGKLGRERVYMVIDREANAKLPSDLAGITPAAYKKPDSGNWQSALGPATTAIENEIKRLGLRKAAMFNLRIVPRCQYGEGGEEGYEFLITNDDKITLPPYIVQLVHNSSLSPSIVFSSEKSGELLPSQRRKHRCRIKLTNHCDKIAFHYIRHPPAGSNVSDGWSVQIVLEDSDVVLFESAKYGSAIARYIRDLHDGSDFTEAVYRFQDAFREEYKKDQG